MFPPIHSKYHQAMVPICFFFFGNWYPARTYYHPEVLHHPCDFLGFIDKAFSVCLMFLTCMISGLTFWYWLTNWCSLPYERLFLLLTAFLNYIYFFVEDRGSMVFPLPIVCFKNYFYFVSVCTLVGWSMCMCLHEYEDVRGKL